MIDKAMFVTGILEELDRLTSSVQGSGQKEAYEQRLKAVVMSALSRLELVSQEQFSAYELMLEKSRQKLEALEKRVSELENLSGKQ